jgi:hypothetical protein
MMTFEGSEYLKKHDQKTITGWWFGTMAFYDIPLILGMSSSQLTNSYFSEG